MREREGEKEKEKGNIRSQVSTSQTFSFVIKAKKENYFNDDQRDLQLTNF